MEIEKKSYILTKRKMIFAESKGQLMILEKGSCGYIVTEDNIINIANLSDSQAIECLEELNKANGIGQTLVLLQGRLRILSADEFSECMPPKFNTIRDGIF